MVENLHHLETFLNWMDPVRLSNSHNWNPSAVTLRVITYIPVLFLFFFLHMMTISCILHQITLQREMSRITVCKSYKLNVSFVRFNLNTPALGD